MFQSPKGYKAYINDYILSFGRVEKTPQVHGVASESPLDFGIFPTLSDVAIVNINREVVALGITSNRVLEERGI